ncbi:NAC domain-containing protein 60 [Daucus carota subsp. sativus]|uniref:NAC domain-containing protein n=1 Tax=Daucus carota subsp. sativus TaxID=79200 RepID=A0A162B340_DAUCS|nr:PREDICTED: NAC domain-containing protein 60 [Daucus carota subsp. sativus]
MGDHLTLPSPNPNPPPSLLPPGCRFFPSDQHLLSVYLTQKHAPRSSRDNSSIPDVIKEINLYDYEPFNLPDSICFRFGKGGRKRHYYCFVVARVRDEERRRGGGAGYWKRTGRVRDVVLGDVVIGTRRAFVFYLGDLGKGGARTDWFMYEYALVEPHLASFVLCRIFVKSRKSNTNTSERPLSSCAQDSVAKVRHIGIQHDGTVDLVPSESNMLGRNSPHRNNQVVRYPMELVRGSDNVVVGWPVDLQLGLSGHASARGMMADPLTAEQLTAILEDDFLELNDLLSPYPGID